MLKALMDFPYAGKTIRRGEYFTAESASDRHLLLLGQRAVEDRGEDSSTTHEEHEGATDDASARRSNKSSSNRYARRDLRAKE